MFTAIVTSHNNDAGLRRILGNLKYQTRPPDEILVYVSESGDLMRLREDFPQAFFFREPNREDWGHEKRAKGVEMAGEEWLGFFNDDDSYEPDYLEKMLAYPEADIVYCNWNGHNASLALGSSTSGNFIVRSGFARRIGYKHRAYEADGLFLEDLKRLNPRTQKVSESLYRHNAQ